MIDNDNLIDNLREESNEGNTITNNEMTNRSIFSRVFSRFLEFCRSLLLDCNRQRKLSTSFVIMPAPKNADCYNMNHKHRGKCIIFNHEEFDGKAPKRKDSIKDVNRLQKSFGRLGFDVEIYNDLRRAEIMDKIKKVSQYDHTDNDCLCIIVLTHGNKKKMIWAKDTAYKYTKIWKQFTADKCTTLAGKPKLFFFQACRGNQVDSGVVLSPHTLLPSEATDTGNRSEACRGDQVDSGVVLSPPTLLPSEATDTGNRSEVILQNSYSYGYREQIGSKSNKYPTHADILIAHSTVQDFVSWRNPVKGAWFIQCLCNVLDEYGTKMDLINMLTLIKRKVATDFSSNSMDKTIHDKKQMPSVEKDTLMRSVYFPPKGGE